MPSVTKLLLLSVLLCTGCTAFYPPSGPKHYAPERFPPSAERLAELVQLTKPPTPYDGKFEITVQPQTLLAGGAVRVRCLVPPTNQDGKTLRFGIENKEMAEAIADHYEHSRIYQHVECGTWKATCTLSNGQKREKEITAIGSCNQDDK